MTELEHLELVLRRVHDRLDRTTRFAASSELYVLKKIIEELSSENNAVHERNRKRA